MMFQETTTNKATQNDTPQPLYEQVKTHVTDHIRQGKWATHAKIPSEHELVRKLGMSRMTIHRALRELTQEGVLKRIQGVGTFVARAQQKPIQLTLPSVREMISGPNGIYSCDILFLQSEPVGAEFSTRMGLRKNDTIFRSYILHKNQGHPVMLEDRYTNPALAPDFLTQDFTKISTDDYLFNACSLISHEHHISVPISTPEIHHYMELDGPTPCLQISRRSWSGNQILSATRLLYPGTAFQLTC
jgi:GntR family transcriptional regulator, histidine utilization repressor